MDVDPPANVSSLKPGDCLVYDFRPDSSVLERHPKKRLTVVQWNIERAYRLDKITHLLRERFLTADIICLQELDIGCERSENANSAAEIARALGMRCVFAVEFIELHSPLRSAKTQGGGVHGNAILSPHFFNYRTIQHRHEPFPWQRQGASRGEPRVGRRITVAAELSIPGERFSILCYCLHLEIFTGIYGRLAQLSEVLRDSWEHRRTNPYQLLCGDLNTCGHSTARYFARFCTDNQRWKSLGLSEPEWLYRNVLDHFHPLSELGDSSPVSTGSTVENSNLRRFHWRHLPASAIRWALNPGFYDPFPVDTESYKLFGGLFKAKLDWILCRGFVVLSRGMGNLDFSASDHRLLWAEGVFLQDVSQIVPYSKRHVRLAKKRHRLRNIVTHKGMMGLFVFLLATLRWVLLNIRRRFFPYF